MSVVAFQPAVLQCGSFAAGFTRSAGIDYSPSRCLQLVRILEHESTDTEATYTIDLIPDSDIALFHWVGPITLEDRLNNLDVMADFCSDNKVRKIIIDGRHQQSMTDTIESRNFGSQVTEAFRGLCVAVVHRPDDKSLALI